MYEEACALVHENLQADHHSRRACSDHGHARLRGASSRRLTCLEGVRVRRRRMPLPFTGGDSAAAAAAAKAPVP